MRNPFWAWLLAGCGLLALAALSCRWSWAVALLLAPLGLACLAAAGCERRARGKGD